MGRALRRIVTGLLSAALIACLVGAAVNGVGLIHAVDVNHRIEQSAPGEIDAGAPERVLYAKAYRLRQAHRLTAALRVYSRIERAPDPALRRAIYYNMGNIYLALAKREAANARIKDIATLVTIARRRYQQALRLNSRYYDAKYNLEYTRFLVTERDRSKQQRHAGINDRRAKEQPNWASLHELPEGLP